jgi:hypothetical protein
MKNEATVLHMALEGLEPPRMWGEINLAIFSNSYYF